MVTRARLRPPVQGRGPRAAALQDVAPWVSARAGRGTGWRGQRADVARPPRRARDLSRARGGGDRAEGGPREAAPTPPAASARGRRPGGSALGARGRLRGRACPGTAVRSRPRAAACRSGSKLRWGARSGNFAQLPFAQVSAREGPARGDRGDASDASPSR